MLSSSARLLRLLTLLQERPLSTAAEVAGTLAVTARTVRRDVDRLRELGYPIESSGGVGGGCRFGSAAGCRRSCSTTTRRSPWCLGCGPSAQVRSRHRRGLRPRV
jgi:biotin operon repressor